MRLERLSEVRAVQAAVAEFQRREPHGARGAQPGGAPPREPSRPAAPSTHAVRPRLAPRTAAGSTGVAAARLPRDVRPRARLPNPARTRLLRRGTERQASRKRSSGPAAAPGSQRAGERVREPPPRLLGWLALQQPRAPSHSSLSRPGRVGPLEPASDDLIPAGPISTPASARPPGLPRTPGPSAAVTQSSGPGGGA